MNGKKGFDFKKMMPYAVALAVIIAIILVYFYPVFQGKKLFGGDIVHFRAMAKEIVDYRAKTGQEPLWTNNMFSGMPAYQISMEYHKNLMTYIHKFIMFGKYLPIGMVILYFLGFYFLLQVMKVNKWLSIAGAIGFAFSSYFFVILVAGHTSKAFAIGYMAPVIAGVILTYRGKYFAGGVISAFFLALEVLSGHPQITYYLMMMILIYSLMELIRHIREKKLADFIKASGILIAAGLLGVLTSTASLWNTYEYSKYSIRGATELSTEKENRTSGLDKDYAVDWSYGIEETMTLLIPGFYGGSSQSSLSKNSETYKTLIDNNIPKADADRFIKGVPLYWGDMRFTSGPVYVGAIILFLFVFSLFYLKGPLKWWGITVTVLSILLSWGKHFMPLTNFFMEYVPLYNKFRAVSMTLVIAEFSIPLLGFIALDKLLKDDNKALILKYLKLTLYILGGILAFFILLAGSLYSYSGPNDASMGFPDWLWTAIRADRLSMLRMDAVRSLVFILLTFGALWLYLKGKLKLSYLLLLLPVLILIDMWPVNKRYISNDDFTRKSQVDTPFQASKADLEILKDNSLSYRVYNFNEAFDQSIKTSYFHKNIGGYHGAKLRRYQEIIDVPLINERKTIISAINDQKMPLEEALQNASAFNMLNTRYFIINENAIPLQNRYACGNAWFVRSYKIVNNADEELAAIDGLRPDSTAVIDKKFETAFSGFSFPKGPKGKIELTSYAPNHLVYESSAMQDEMAVFSEVYYDKGWNVYIDGKKVPYFRADFILRAMIVPAGDHKIEWKFEPKSYYVGQNVSLAASLLVILLTLGALGYSFFGKRNQL